MRERTPSADDTPKRAPPAPPREAASADVAGSKTSSEAAEVFHAAKFSPSTTTAATPNTAATTTAASSPSSVDARMVASTHNLDDLGVSHPASANGDRQQQQEKHGHTYRSAQTAQDKRSRLSNVINNLRKKVPDTRNGDSARKEEDDRNSVERNLETLEKYVMTVLNGVIKDEEDNDVGQKKEVDKDAKQEKLAEDHEDEDSKGPGAKFEPSKPNESRTETAVLLLEQSEASENVVGGNAGKEPCLEYQKPNDKDEGTQQLEDSVEVNPSEAEEEIVTRKADKVDEGDACKDSKCSSKEAKSEASEAAKSEVQEEEKKENRSLGTIIMERLSDHQVDEKTSTDSAKEDPREFVSENVELRNICRDLLNDLLNGINQLIDENCQEKEDKTPENSSEESRNSKNPDLVMTGLHCSLPLDKVASVLQNCQTSDSAGPQLTSPPSSSSSSSQGTKFSFKPPSPTVRHLCLYCDRKFLSISLRQRHTERVHQQGGGRRSERNSRRPSQNCQYCSDKCAESLEGLFQHMVGNHGDKYHACVQCSTRYPNRETLVCHISENHGGNVDRNLQTQEKMKEPAPMKELVTQSTRDKPESLSLKERRPEEPGHEHRTESILLKPIVSTKDIFSNPGSPEFDSSFYSSVSCNIRENLLHHLDGKLQSSSSSMTTPTSSIVDTKPQQQQPQQQQSFYEHGINQIQLPIDISLTAATPVYSKEYSNEDYENSSEYAQKPGKSNRTHPRRVSFEKYNFPRKYDGKEQWTCSIKDLSKFDISTQLSLRKKQQLLKERITLNRIRQIPLLEVTDIVQDESLTTRESEESQELQGDRKNAEEQTSHCETAKSKDLEVCETKPSPSTEFSTEFSNFLRLRKWDEKTSSEAAKMQEVVYAELTGEWSRPRIYICGACASKHVTLREMEEHKALSHPNVWCSHFEFSGDQRELYKHLFLPGKDVPTAKAKAAILIEKVCTKCSRNCNTLPELHRHMLECGGDQAWLLGLFGNGKKKCKWRPFGSRSRRRRQRGMKRNIQNSQTPRVTTPKEKQPTGPRVRPSDRESIQKMLANLPPKRATRKVMQDSALRTQGRLRNVQTRSRPRMVGDNSTASRMSRNKAALKNKLLKNAKSIQRNRCRIDNISAVIESVVRNYNHTEEKKPEEKAEVAKANVEKDAKEKKEDEAKGESIPEPGAKAKIVRGPRILNKKRNMKIKQGAKIILQQAKKPGNFKTKYKMTKNSPEGRVDSTLNEPVKTPKSIKLVPKSSDRDSEPDTSSSESKSSSSPTKNKLSIQTTPKKKRPVDPVASLNASIKAKSQLRSQDGKFARNPNKSFQKSPQEVKPPGRPPGKAKSNEASPETVTRSKLRGVYKSKTTSEQLLPKRITRLSSDSDKMPTLEPVVQITSGNEEEAQTSVNDLPILSPVTPSGTEKSLRGKNLAGKTLEDKESSKMDEEVEEKKDAASESTEEERDAKQAKTRRQKGDGKNFEKSSENVKDDSVKEKPKVAKEKMKRKSAPGRIANVEERKTAKTAAEETTPKKDPKQKTLETRSNSRAKFDMVDPEIKIQNVPFEVKKLIGSNSKEDLLTKLVLTSRVGGSKRCLRQPSKAKDEGKSKVQKDLEPEKSVPEQESVSDGSGKKEKSEFRRKSLRKTEKKQEKTASKSDQAELTEASKIVTALNEAKSAVRGRRNSSSLSNELKSVISVSEEAAKEVESPETDNENSSNKRQTRGSLMNTTDGDQQQTKETPVESNDMSLKKTTSLGKRRGRIKSGSDVAEKKNSEVTKNEVDKSITEPETLDKDESNERNDKAAVVASWSRKDEDSKDKEEDPESLKVHVNPPEAEKVEVENVNLNVNHLQLETGSSMDSGKENSLETVVGVQKLKVGRPRKSWGTRREKASKRSLNNVIGILTEGMNIPVESQQSVVLTVQTSLENASDGSVQAGGQQAEEESSKSLDLEKSEKIEADEDPDKLADESSACVGNAEEKEPSSEIPLATDADSSTNDNKEPANDIILDLSRRKQKGKGSFLEKIVSKIAKQKDALLEGEVGSLLDTAADELTSILDEVAPGFSEDGSADAKSDKTSIQKRIQASSRAKSDENCLPDSKSEDDPDEQTGIVNDEIVQEEMKEESPEPSLDQIVESESESLDKGDNSLSAIKKGVSEDPKVVVEEAKSVPNGILPPLQECTSESTSMIKSEKQEDKFTKKEQEPATKVHRKSKKRSLEGSSPKKNKRKSVDPADIVDENPIVEELHLASIMKLMNKSKEVPSTKESDEDELYIEKVVLGKRKTLNDDDSRTDESSGSNAANDVETMDSSDGVKKFKSETETEKQGAENGEGKVAVGVSESPKEEIRDNAEEETLIVNEETQVEEKTPIVEEQNQVEEKTLNVEEKSPVDAEEKTRVNAEQEEPQAAGKRRKSSIEREPEVDSTIRRSSKRRSIVEEKTSQEEEVSSKSVSEAVETTRRRSQRSKLSIQSNEEQLPKENVTASSDIVTEITEETTKNSLEKGIPPIEDVPSVKEAKVVEENSSLQAAEIEETSKGEETPECTLKKSEKTTSTGPKVLKKRGRKKKSVGEHATVPNHTEEASKVDEQSPVEPEPLLTIAANQGPSRKSSRVSRTNEEGEDQQSASSNSDNFKVPELTEILQHTKKRTSKRKSMTDEHLEVQSSLPLTEPEVSNVDSSETSKIDTERDEEVDNSQKETPEVRKRVSKTSNKLLERSSSSGSIDLIQTNRTRSSKRKQLSSEDLSQQDSLHRRPESTDNLSESSCVSESSYFRRKRFSKKKKGFEEPAEDVQTDTSVTDSESVDTQKTTDRRQSLKRRAKKNISFFEDQFDLVDDFDIPMDLQDCLDREETLRNIQSTAVDEKIDEEVTGSDSKENEEEKVIEKEDAREEPVKAVEAEEAVQPVEPVEHAEPVELETSVEKEEDEDVEKANVKADDTPQTQEDFQTPKKRTAGNFVVVHKKTGEILIVEKRKKLTKEAARFFCDVCATSFTRKSSLKKHNQSQSHLLQMINSKKEKTANESSDEASAVWKNEKSSPDETVSDETKNFANESVNCSQEYSDQQGQSNSPVAGNSEELDSLRRLEEDVHAVEQELLIDPQIKQRTLEDELLDEEICKITENMSHDEYVLTEHTSPLPECTSTPIKAETKKEDDSEKKKKHEKKKDKGKKKNLVEEQLPSDISDPEALLDSLTLTVLDSSASLKISESSFANSSETSINENQVLRVAENDQIPTNNFDTIEKEENHLDAGTFVPEVTDMETVKLNGQKVDCSESQLFDLKRHPAKKTENFPEIDSDNNPTSQDNRDPLSLEHTVNKCNEDSPKGSDSNSNELETFRETDSSYVSDHHILKESIEGSDSLKPEEQSDAGMNLLNDLQEVQQVDRVKDSVDTDQTVLSDSLDHQSLPLVAEDKVENAPALQNDSTKTSRHSKSKKSKSKKHEQTDNSPDGPAVKKASKSKVNQSKQKEYVKPAETVNDQNQSADCSKISGLLESEEKLESSLSSSQVEENVTQIVDDTEFKSNEEEVIDSQKFYSNIETLLNESVEKNKSCIERDEVKSFEEEDESSSSLEDKPLAQILLMAEEKLQIEKKEQPPFLKDPETAKPEEVTESQDTTSENIEPDIETPKFADEEPTNIAAPEVPSENESEVLKPVEDSDKDVDKISSEYENTEAVPEAENTVDEKAISNGRKSNASDRQNSTRKSFKSYKYSGKDLHRKSRTKKMSQRSKIAGLTSESDDSDAEDKLESQNKSKIVKSVFGRVFGGEKTDKVKEVLNDWVSKSEDDSDASRTDSHHNLKIKEGSETKHEDRNAKRHSVSSHTSQKKRAGKKSRKNSSSDKVKDQAAEDQEEHRSKHAKSKSSNRKKGDTEASNYYFLVLPPTSCRPSKKRAEERISRAFEDDALDSYGNKIQKNKQKEINYDLRNQGKDAGAKDNGYGSFNYEDDPSKLEALEETAEKDQKPTKKRKSSSSRKSKSKSEESEWKDSADKSTEKSTKDSEEEDDSLKDPEGDPLINQLSVDLDSSNSCSSLAQSDVRDRSPSVDRNSHTSRDSDIDEEDDNEEMGHRRISPLFVCGTPRSSIESSSNSENEEEDEKAHDSEVRTRKRSSSEFSSGKIVIRSPSSTHKTEMVTIAPTDAIEDNALDVPQEIEAAKPRQGKVLNFDEELFVECCSRLKATTENELRGTKKIKLDHNDGYHRTEDQHLRFRGPRDRWRDVESQNSLGSLLESVNQLLGEEMYSARERGYQKRGGRNLRSEHSSRSASPDMSRAENLGYEDSLDVAFEHNNKLRDKIQQRMRESESLIASTFGHKSDNEIADGEHPLKNTEQNILRNPYTHRTDEGHMTVTNLSNGDYNDDLHVRCLQEQNSGKLNLDSPGFKSKMNSTLGGLLDKALSNLLHNNGKHDHNGSTPMKVLAELACARAPTSTAGDQNSQEDVQSSMKIGSQNKESTPETIPLTVIKDQQKKIRNPIKELFERKKEMNERKQQEKSKAEAALRELNVHRQRKTKKAKKHQDFPLIRRNEHGGLAERKKRRDGFERKEEFASDRIKDVYEFDEEESQMETNLGGVMSYRNRPGYEVSCLRTKEVDVAGLMSKAIGESLENGKTGDALSTRLESMIDRKFKELEKFAPKTKGALKAFQSEEQQRQITGPMDEFVERNPQKPKRVTEQNMKHSRLKKRSKNPKKKTRNAWYENDSSDEYRTAVKAKEDVGVGISKSQRTCSKGKQNIFAELYTSESEFDDEDADYETKKQRKAKKSATKVINLGNMEQGQEMIEEDYRLENEEDEWRDQRLRDDDRNKNDCDNKKSESEMSDQPLVIDERKDSDEQRNSDEETEAQYERNFELDDLYRVDSSMTESDAEESTVAEAQDVNEPNEKDLSPEKTNDQADYPREDELIPLEEALDLLDQTDANLEASYDNLNKEAQSEEQIDAIALAEPVEEQFEPVHEAAEKSPSPEEEQEEEDDVLALPEKLSTNEKPQNESENLPLHVFLSRKVQESKKRKEQQLKKIQEEQERILLDFQPTRRQRKCAIGKQGLLAEISSSDEEMSLKDNKRYGDKLEHEKQRKQKRESKEKRKERYIEKKHEQMIAKEQKAIEDEILRELGKKKEQGTTDIRSDSDEKSEPKDLESMEHKISQEQVRRKKHQTKEKQKKNKEDEATVKKVNEQLSDVENNCNRSIHAESNQESEDKPESPNKQKKHTKSPAKPKRSSKGDTKVVATGKKGKNSTSDKSRSRTDTKGSKDKERRSSSGRRDSDDEELKTTKSWNKVEEGVGVAIGRRKRAAVNQLYYWSSSSDEEEILEVVPTVEEEEDDRQEQHGWIVGDSHKRMITMLAMEKQLKEKRRRSEDEFEPGKAKSKKHRNSTS